jgi:hypothetical protein
MSKIEPVLGLVVAIGAAPACGGNGEWLEDEPPARASSALHGDAMQAWNPTPPGVGYLSTPSLDYRTGTAVCKKGRGKFLVVTVRHGRTLGDDYPTTSGSFVIGGTTYTGGDCRSLFDPSGFVSDVRLCEFTKGRGQPYPSTVAAAVGTFTHAGTLYDAYTCLRPDGTATAGNPTACALAGGTITPLQAKMTMTYNPDAVENNADPNRDCDTRTPPGPVAGLQYPATNGLPFSGLNLSGVDSNDGGNAWITWDRECSDDEDDDDSGCIAVPHLRGINGGVWDDGTPDHQTLIICISAFTSTEAGWIQSQCEAL